MGIEKVADAKEDREHWLETRKNYLGASSICGWRGPSALPAKYDWYFGDNNQETIVAQKFQGVEKTFPAASQVSMDNGAHDEENIIRKVEASLGYRCEPDNSMMVNSRWPHLAATADCFVHTDSEHDIGVHPDANFCQDGSIFPALRDTIRNTGMGLLEIKKSTSVGWARGEVPAYYVPQLKTQMAIMRIPWVIICAECIYIDPRQKWRKYWDLRPTLFFRDFRWDDVLDQVNAEFGAAKGKHLTQSDQGAKLKV